MESVMRCFSNIYNQNKVYKGFKVQGYCPSCATPLANNEIAEGYEKEYEFAAGEVCNNGWCFYLPKE